MVDVPLLKSWRRSLKSPRIAAEESGPQDYNFSPTQIVEVLALTFNRF